MLMGAWCSGSRLLRLQAQLLSPSAEFEPPGCPVTRAKRVERLCSTYQITANTAAVSTRIKSKCGDNYSMDTKLIPLNDYPCGARFIRGEVE